LKLLKSKTVQELKETLDDCAFLLNDSYDVWSKELQKSLGRRKEINKLKKKKKKEYKNITKKVRK